MRSKISVALATYNGERFLLQQLKSFCQQTRLPDELVVSDDNSSDSTRSILHEFSVSAPFAVRIYLNVGERGVTENFASALRKCQGDIVCLSDQDDVWLPNHIEILSRPIDVDPSINLVISNSSMVDDNLVPLGYSAYQSYQVSLNLINKTNKAISNQFELFLRHRIFLGHSLAFRSCILPQVLPFSENCGHDQWVALVAAAAGRLLYVEESLTLYRIHSAQVSDHRRKSVLKLLGESRRSHTVVTEDELAKCVDLRKRVLSIEGLADSVLPAIDAKIEFLRFRNDTRRLKVLPRALRASRALVLMRYHKLSRGFLAFARDICALRS